MRRNPYLSFLPISEPSEFYGRSSEIAKLYELLAQAPPCSVWVCGAYRIGKSSLARYIAHPQTIARYLPNAQSFAFVMVAMDSIFPRSPEGFFRSLLRGLNEAVPHQGISSLPSTAQSCERALQELTAFGRRLIVLVDEFEPTPENSNFDLGFYNFLRWINREFYVCYVVFSRVDLHFVCQTGGIPDDRFATLFEPMPLGPFTESEAADFVIRSSEKAGRPMAPYVQNLLGITGIWPFFIRIGCARLFERLEGKVVRADILRVVEEDFNHEARNQFPLLWKSLTDEEQSTCCSVALGHASPQSLQVQRLVTKGHVRILEGKPRLLCPAFETFVREKRELLQRPSMMPPIPEKINGYDVECLIGGGGMGCVYKVTHRMTKRRSALKLMRHELMSAPEFKERFYREIERAAQVKHPNIVLIEYAGEENGIPYLVMELVEGQGMDKIIPHDEGLAEDLVLDIGMQITSALQALHQEGLIHRDIKPSNIILDCRRRAKLTDFGLARLSAERARLTQTGDRLGTPEYMSPEQRAGKEPLDIRSDIYSLGMTLTHMLLGHALFKVVCASGNPNHSAREELSRLHRQKRLSEKTLEVICKMVHSTPDGRPENPIRLYEELRAARKVLDSSLRNVITETEV